MAHTSPRYIPPDGALVEVTTRTVQSRYLLRPSQELEDLTIGILARAYAEYPVDLIGVVSLSNHLHLLLWVDNQYLLSKFMEYLNGNLAREVNRLHGRTGPVWERRYRAIVVTDEEQAQVDRLKYLLSQSVKENLVSKVKHWPGLHFGQALLEDRQILGGTWVSHTEEYRIKNRGEKVKKEDVTSRHEIRLAQLPCWRHLTYGEYCKEVRKLIGQIEEEAALERKLEETETVGARAVLEKDPETVPAKTKKSYAPRVHAASREARKEFLTAWGWFFGEYRDAAAELQKGNRDARFPEGCFPPGLPYVGDTGLEKPPDALPD